MSDVGRGSRRAGAGLALGVMVFALVATAASGDPRDPAAQDQGARHVLVVTLDGLRGQELFSGYAAELNTEESGGVVSPDALAGRFDAPTPEGRRERLLPFLWTVVAEGLPGRRARGRPPAVRRHARAPRPVGTARGRGVTRVAARDRLGPARRHR